MRRDAQRAVKLAKDIMWSRRAQRELLKKLADRPPLEPHRFRVGVYFADGRVNLYQLRQWYRPLVGAREAASGAHPQPRVGVGARSSSTSRPCPSRTCGASPTSSG